MSSHRELCLKLVNIIQTRMTKNLCALTNDSPVIMSRKLLNAAGMPGLSIYRVFCYKSSLAMEHFWLKGFLIRTILFSCLFTAALAIQCNPASSETISSWPKSVSGSAQLFQFQSTDNFTTVCVSFQATRAQSVLQLEFHCDEKYRSQLEPILTDLRRTEAFGVRNWNPLLVESCSGEDVLAALGPVGVEQSPLNVDCTIFIPRPNSTFRVDIPLAHDSFCVFSLTGNKSTPFSTWNNPSTPARAAMFGLKKLTRYRNNAVRVFCQKKDLLIPLIVVMMVRIGFK